jgi:hypothetical protein
MADKQYIRGKDCMVFVTTENADAAVDLTGPTAKAADPLTFTKGVASCDGVGALGLTSIEADSKDRIMDVVGVSYTASGEDETITLLNSSKDRDIPLRDVGEVTITMVGKSHNFAKLNKPEGRFGVIDETTMHDGLAPYTDSTGYRVYLHFIKEGKTMVFYHCTLPSDGFSEEIDKSSTQTLKFKSNNWKPDVADADLSKVEPLE